MFLLQSNLVLMGARDFYSPTISVLLWTWELLTQGLFPPSPITAGKFYPAGKHKKGKCYNYFVWFQKAVFPRKGMSLLAVALMLWKHRGRSQRCPIPKKFHWLYQEFSFGSQSTEGKMLHPIFGCSQLTVL